MKQKIKSLQIIHLALCAGPLVAYFTTGQITLENLMIYNVSPNDLIYLAIPVLAIIASNFFFKFQLRQINAKLSQEENWAVYQTASLIRWAILEGASFVILFTKPNLALLGLLLILYLLFLRPTESRINGDFQNNNSGQ